MNKQKLREIYKQKRIELTETKIQEFQESIYQQIHNLDLSEVKNVHLFLSMKKFKEIDTKPIIDYFRSQGNKIVVSSCNFKSNTLSHFYLEENTVLELNKFGVPEPINAKGVLEKELDLIFVPMLISDDKSIELVMEKDITIAFYRIAEKDAKLIGLNFFKPIQEIDDINEFDIPLHQIIYPK